MVNWELKPWDVFSIFFVLGVFFISFTDAFLIALLVLFIYMSFARERDGKAEYMKYTYYPEPWRKYVFANDN